MGLFGGKDQDNDQEALAAEVERLDALPLGALAAEVMAKAFGPGADYEDPAEEVTVGGPNAGAGATVEGITPVHTSMNGLDYTPSRLGRRVLAAGQVAEAVEGRLTGTS